MELKTSFLSPGGPNTRDISGQVFLVQNSHLGVEMGGRLDEWHGKLSSKRVDFLPRESIHYPWKLYPRVPVLFGCPLLRWGAEPQTPVTSSGMFPVSV